MSDTFIKPETKRISDEVVVAMRKGTMEAWAKVVSMILNLETERDELREALAVFGGRLETAESERDELRAEVERLKAEAELYSGWAKWKAGIWKITHEGGNRAEFIADAMKGAE